MKKNLLFSFLLLTSFFCKIQAQTTNSSIATGNWSGTTTWSTGAAPGSNTNVTISSPNIVTLDASGKTCLNLTIQSGAQLKVGSTATNVIRPGTGAASTAGIISTIQNDGIFGVASGTDGISFELAQSASQVTFNGAGTYIMGRIANAKTANYNYPSSSITGHANSASLIINSNVTCTGNSYVFSTANGSTPYVNSTDVINFTINAGKTLTATDPASKWENSIMNGGTAGPFTGGAYTYNINGTLDLSASTTGTTAFVPYSNSSSSITVNINGTVKLGSLFKADTVNATNVSQGALYLNIGDGGLLDATNTTSFNVGRAGIVGYPNNNGNFYFVVTGNTGGGVIKRTVQNSGSQTKFPIGTSLTSYSPASITRPTTVAAPAVFSVNVQNTFDNAPPSTTQCVNKQWNITLNSGAADATDTIRLSWLTADQQSGFDPTQLIKGMHWNGTSWDGFPATISGSGTLADPYVAKFKGVTSYSPFGIINASALALSFLNINASLNSNKTTSINWSTTNEINVKEFSIERSEDGINFTTIGNVNALNKSSINNYSFMDNNANSNLVFYRIKELSTDGKSSYSKIVSLKNNTDNNLFIYPNPANNSLHISYVKADKNTKLFIYDIDGKLLQNQLLQFGTTQANINITNLKTGKYNIVVSSENNKQVSSFIKN